MIRCSYANGLPVRRNTNRMDICCDNHRLVFRHDSREDRIGRFHTLQSGIRPTSREDHPMRLADHPMWRSAAFLSTTERSRYSSHALTQAQPQQLHQPWQTPLHRFPCDSSRHCYRSHPQEAYFHSREHSTSSCKFLRVCVASHRSRAACRADE